MESPRYLYHGTSTHQFEKMRAHEFQTRDDLYLAVRHPQLTGADYYAQETSAQDGSDPVVITLDVSKLDGELLPDLMEVQNTIDYGETHAWWGRDVEVPMDVSWEESIREFGTAAFEGSFGDAIVAVEPLDQWLRTDNPAGLTRKLKAKLLR